MTGPGSYIRDKFGRSTTRRKRTKIEGAFAPRLIEMLESPAWAVLSLAARRVLDRIEIELAHHGGADNGSLPVTYNDFIHFGVSRESIAPAIRELQGLGFVEVTERGAAGNREFRRPSLYRLTYRYAGHEAPTHGWRRVATMDDAERIARAARKTNEERGRLRSRQSPIGFLATRSA